MGWPRGVVSSPSKSATNETGACSNQNVSGGVELSSSRKTTGEEPSTYASPAATESNEEVFQIIDEAGEGWGFDLDPATVAKPLAITSAALFGVGMLTGIPAGIALGRSAEASKKAGQRMVVPTAGGVFFALRAFLYGTLLCGTAGATAAYCTAYYYDAWSWKDFGDVMRRVVPHRRGEIENAVLPILNSVRGNASSTLPGHASQARDWFGDTRLGIYIRNGIERATAVADKDGLPTLVNASHTDTQPRARQAEKEPGSPL